MARFEALVVAGDPDDIVLLDMELTDSLGIDVAKRMNGKGYGAEMIAITAVRHLQVIRSVISNGVTQCLIKPVTFAAFRKKLDDQRAFRLSFTGNGSLATQESVDDALSALRSVSSERLPKGLIEEMLAAISTEVAIALELSRVTVNRYLEHLVKTKQAGMQPGHGVPGRPEYEYRWV